MTPISREDDSDLTASVSAGPAGSPEDAEVPPGADTLEDILSGARPSGHVLTADRETLDQDPSDQLDSNPDASDQDASDQDASDGVDRDSEESFPASDPPANY